jgi:peptidase E
MEPDNPLLDDFVLSLARRKAPRVCFIPTASADSPMYVARFYRAFSGRCVPTDLTFADPTGLPRQPRHSSELADFVDAQDVFYVGGGNTANLLAVWRAHGLDVLLKRAWRRGAVLSGLSAGMLCWFSGGPTDSFGALRPLADGLELIRASACPHYDGEPGRRPAFQKMVGDGALAGYAADDGAALHFVGTKLKEAVSSRPEARAYRVEMKRGRVVETALATRYLGARSRR